MHIVILPTPLIFIFYTEKICLHPDEIIGDIVNQNEELTWYFLDGRTYYLTCPPGFDVPAEGTLWECVDGMWQSGSDCVGNFAIKINQSNPDFLEVGCTPSHTLSTPITTIPLICQPNMIKQLTIPIFQPADDCPLKFSKQVSSFLLPLRL